MEGGAWWAAVRGVTKSRTRLSNFTFYTRRLLLQSHFFFINFSSTELFLSPRKHVIVLLILKWNEFPLTCFL